MVILIARCAASGFHLPRAPCQFLGQLDATGRLPVDLDRCTMQPRSPKYSTLHRNLACKSLSPTQMAWCHLQWKEREARNRTVYIERHINEPSFNTNVDHVHSILYNYKMEWPAVRMSFHCEEGSSLVQQALSALAVFLSWWGPKTCLDTPNDRDHQKRHRFTQAWMKPGITFILAVKDSRQGSNPESKPQLQNLHRQYLRINPPKVLNFACVSVFDGFKFPSSLWFCDLDSDAFTA